MDTQIVVLDEAELSSCCRVCLKQPEEVLDLDAIYDEEDQLTYSNCFTLCTNIDLNEGDGIPRNLCKLCGIELQMAYDFHKKVLDATRQLKQLWRDIPHEVVITEDETQSESASRKRTRSGEESSSVENHIEMEESVEISMDDFEEHLEFEEYQSVDSLDEGGETIQIRIETASDGGEHVYRQVPFKRVRDGIHRETVKIRDDVNDDGNYGGYENEDDIDDEYRIAEYGAEDATEEISHKVMTRLSSVSDLDDDSDTDWFSSYQKASKAIRPKPILKKSRRKRHSGKFKCGFCDKVFPHHSRMIIHQRLHEPNRPKYPCAECGRIYATKQALEVHTRSAHTKNGYPCNICGKIYAIRKSLEVHIRYHTGDFPYACDDCDKKFAQIGHLNTHKKVKHNSARFCCTHPECGKYFTSSASLRNHEFSHTAMPFECEYCHRGYPAKAKLKVHIKSAHGKEVTLEEMEPMRKFYVIRSKLNLVQLDTNEDGLI